MTTLPKLRFLDNQGREIPDPDPLEIPARFKRPETLAEQIRRVTQGALSLHAAEQGFESFEEAEDFDIDDDSFDPSSPYEEIFDPVLGRGITAEEFRKNEHIYRQRYEEAEKRAWQAYDASEALRGIRKTPSPASSSKDQKQTPSSPPGGGTEGGGASDPTQ